MRRDRVVAASPARSGIIEDFSFGGELAAGRTS
jgi:hypothetical protein